MPKGSIMGGCRRCRPQGRQGLLDKLNAAIQEVLLPAAPMTGPELSRSVGNLGSRSTKSGADDLMPTAGRLTGRF